MACSHYIAATKIVRYVTLSILCITRAELVCIYRYKESTAVMVVLGGGGGLKVIYLMLYNVVS